MLKVRVEAEDEEGLRLGFEVAVAQRQLLAGCRSAGKRDGRFMTTGTVEWVRDLVVYGTVDRPKAAVGKPYKTPEWMIVAEKRQV
jgi:hypothetical protein